MKIGVLLFDAVEELDWAGPWEVLGMAAAALPAPAGDAAVQVQTVAQRPDPVRCAHGLRVIPDATLAEVPALDVVVVPGGQGTRREVDNPVVLAWIEKVAADARWVTSVCTGSLLLSGAGLTRGRRVTTHWRFVEELQRRYPETEVLDHVRYVCDGNLVTAAGVSAGIDMGLWLVGQIWSRADARRVQRMMEYDPAPPYTAEV